MAAEAGFEPASFRLTGGHTTAVLPGKVRTGAPSRFRPCGLLGFNQALYPLSYRCVERGATYGIRTRGFSLDRRALWPLS